MTLFNGLSPLTFVLTNSVINNLLSFTGLKFGHYLLFRYYFKVFIFGLYPLFYFIFLFFFSQNSLSYHFNGDSYMILVDYQKNI